MFGDEKISRDFQEPLNPFFYCVGKKIKERDGGSFSCSLEEKRDFSFCKEENRAEKRTPYACMGEIVIIKKHEGAGSSFRFRGIDIFQLSHFMTIFETEEFYLNMD